MDLRERVDMIARSGFLLFSAIMTLSLWSNSVHAGIDPHTVVAWTFDEGQGKFVEDVSGNGHDGELLDGADWSKDGKFSGAVEFDGMEACIEASHSDGLNLEAFSIEAWINCVPGSNQAILHKQGEGNSSNRNYILNIRPEGFLRGSFSSGGTQYDFDGPTILEPSRWYHVAATYDGKVGKIYVDGELDSETEIDLILEPNDAPLLLGKAGGTGGARFTGLMDEVRLSNIARIQDEIGELMNKGLALVLPVNTEGKLAIAWGGVKFSVLGF
jgi:hypothetical protein